MPYIMSLHVKRSYFHPDNHQLQPPADHNLGYDHNQQTLLLEVAGVHSVSMDTYTYIHDYVASLSLP